MSAKELRKKIIEAICCPDGCWRVDDCIAHDRGGNAERADTILSLVGKEAVKAVKVVEGRTDRIAALRELFGMGSE